MRETRGIFDADLHNIWNYRQNHPELVVKDCKNHGFTDNQCKIVRQSLLVRGVNKWLKVRRDIIVYKIQIRAEIKYLQQVIPVLKSEMTALYCTTRQIHQGEKSPFDLEAYYRKRIAYQCAKEQLKLLQQVRGTLKKMCMAERWQIWEGKDLRDMNTLKTSNFRIRRAA